MLLLDHRKARQLYDVAETMEAGIILSGPEVKSLRGKHGSLQGSFVTLTNGRPVLLNAQIPAYQFAAQPDYEPTQTRPLLLHAKQIETLESWLAGKGHTAVPLQIELKGRWIKVLIGLTKGKKQFERKAELKQRDLDREFQRTLKSL